MRVYVVVLCRLSISRQQTSRTQPHPSTLTPPHTPSTTSPANTHAIHLPNGLIYSLGILCKQGERGKGENWGWKSCKVITPVLPYQPILRHSRDANVLQTEAKKKPVSKLTATELGVSFEPQMEIIRVVEPPKRSGGTKVESVDDLVEKLKAAGFTAV